MQTPKEVIVYFVYETENNDGHYQEDDPERDYPEEVFVRPTWSKFLKGVKYAYSDLRKAFDSEDSDCDFTRYVAYVVDEKGTVLYDRSSKNLNQVRDRLIELSALGVAV